MSYASFDIKCQLRQMTHMTLELRRKSIKWILVSKQVLGPQESKLGIQFGKKKHFQ